MTTMPEVGILLRFLAQDAKVPLKLAMSKVKALQDASLANVDVISKTNLQTLTTALGDEKLSKQILNAAKRKAKKRSADDSEDQPTTTRTKKPKSINYNNPASDLPLSNLPLSDLANKSILTNRAPVLLAFAVTLLAHTMPSQPLSNRLSLAQGIVSANSKSKAVSLGIENLNSNDEIYSSTQPKITILTREIPVLRKFQEDGETSEDSPLWALDISSGYLANGKIRAAPRSSTLPIHTPDAARAYLLKSFYNVPKDGNETAKVVPTTVAQRIENLGMLLKALDALFSSWVGVLSKQELDRKAWAWYVDVRPEVEGGVKGWGEKGILELGKILSLRRVDVKDEKTDGGS